MTSMKKIIAVLLMGLMIGCVVFAEAHKKQIVVTCEAGPIGTPTIQCIGGKAVVNMPKNPSVAIPDGWHVVCMWVEPSTKAASVKYYFVLEEN